MKDQAKMNTNNEWIGTKARLSFEAGYNDGTVDALNDMPVKYRAPLDDYNYIKGYDIAYQSAER